MIDLFDENYDGFVRLNLHCSSWIPFKSIYHCKRCQSEHFSIETRPTLSSYWKWNVSVVNLQLLMKPTSNNCIREFTWIFWSEFIQHNYKIWGSIENPCNWKYLSLYKWQKSQNTRKPDTVIVNNVKGDLAMLIVLPACFHLKRNWTYKNTQPTKKTQSGHTWLVHIKGLSLSCTICVVL